ncbi:hypothetical protein ACFY0G_01955 [Streptomyces sp. NPDC001552]|uniref:hypothetical protein n=1 Tax=Streptomyces sp. NPDC001552 TaxID=3364587 RepID=UPI00369F9D75
MQSSRIPTVVTVATAAALGLAGGAAATALIDGDTVADIASQMTTGVLSTAVVTAAALFVIRRWLAGYDARTRQALATVAAQQRAIEDQQAANERTLIERAAAVTRESAAAQDRMRAIGSRLDEFARGRAAEQQELATLRQTNTELLDEYNALVQESVRATAVQFARKDCHPAPGPRRLAAAELVPEQRAEPHPADATAPPLVTPH